MRSALALLLGLATVGSLALNARPHRAQLARPRFRLSRSSGLAGVRMQNEEEIAELEARLAGLKKVKEEEAEAERLAAIVPLSADEVKEFDATTFSYRKKVANVKEANIADELLSESWKEEEGAPGIGGFVLPIVGAVVIFIALALVPSGNNEIYVGSQPVPMESAESIRARYSDVQEEE